MRAAPPFCPPELKERVNHAERFARLISTLRGCESNAISAAWLSGRREEIAVVVDDCIARCNAPGTSAQAAAVALAAYLDSLHNAVQHHFPGVSLTCCPSSNAVSPARRAPPPAGLNSAASDRALAGETPAADITYVNLTVADILAFHSARRPPPTHR